MKLQQLRYLVGIAREGFQRVAGGEPAWYLAAGNQQADPDAGDRARRRSLDPPQQPHPRADRGRRGDHRAWRSARSGRRTISSASRGVHAKRAAGRLVIATTHMYARYVLRPVIKDFMQSHRRCNSSCARASLDDRAMGRRRRSRHRHQRTIARRAPGPGVSPVRRAPAQRVRAQAASAGAGEASDARRDRPVPDHHARPRHGRRTEGHGCFAAARIKPNIVLSAIDADVVKSYVELGLGIAVLLTVAYRAGARSRAARDRAPPTCFEPTTPHIVLRHGKYLTGLHARIHRPAVAAMSGAVGFATRSRPRAVLTR